jgi:tetratricopeptide (TPR) repeat protein/cell division protein FtsN
MLYQNRCRSGIGRQTLLRPIQLQARVNTMQTQFRGMDGRHRFWCVVGLMVLLGTLLLTTAAAMAAENWFEMGLADLKERHYQAAVDKFTRAIEAVPEDFEALNNRGFARIYTGDYEGAIDDCSRSIAINPGSAKGFNNRGFARLFTGEYDAAIADFNQALAINPRYVDAYSNRCLAWTRKTQYAEAIADCTEALHLNPRSAKALYNRGYARDRQGDPGGAMRDYIQALNINPAYVEVFNNMAWIMATSPDSRLRDGHRAVAYAEKAVGHDGAPDINFLDTLAAAYAEDGRFDEAIAIENRIVSLLAAARRAEAIPLHVKRMNLYENRQPYREPIKIQPVSAVTDLQSELASLDKLVFEPAAPPILYASVGNGPALSPDSSRASNAARPMLLAQADTPSPVTVPEAYSQSVQTAPDMPVEITLDAETDGRPLTFELETVPYQGTLQGTLPHLLYTPRPGFEGQDRFTFRARNAVGPSNLATVNITVGAPKAAPEAAPPTPAAPPAADGAHPNEDLQEEDLTASEPAPPDEKAPDATTAPPPEATPETPPPAETSPAVAEPAPSMPAPAETMPAVDLPSDAVYTIQVGSVKDAAGAAGTVAKLQAEGFAAFSRAVDVPDKGEWHRIFINGYPTMDAAREALAQLDPERFKGAFIRRLPNGAGVPASAPEPAKPADAPAPEPAVTTEAPAPPGVVPANPPAPAPEAPAQASPPAASAASEPATDAESGEQAIAVAETRFPYAYQVKSYKQREEAFQLGVELTTQGHKAYIGRGTMGSTGVWYRVYVGCYQTPEEAEKNRSEIAREGFPEAFLTPIAYAIEVAPDATDPEGATLENRLMASGFLPYRLPSPNAAGRAPVLVGGFRHPEDARQVLAALEQSGFKGEIRPR